MKLLWFVRQTDAGWEVLRQDKLLYWPITSSLDHSTLRYLQDPLSSSASWPRLLNRRPGMGHRPQQAHSQWLQTAFDSAFTDSLNLRLPNWRQQPSGGTLTDCNWLSLWPSLPPTDTTATGICIYYFIMPTYSRLDHMIFFSLFIQVRLWLTAQSRVNM